jgi:hypothetical protein
MNGIVNSMINFMNSMITRVVVINKRLFRGNAIAFLVISQVMLMEQRLTRPGVGKTTLAHPRCRNIYPLGLQDLDRSGGIVP